MRSPYGAVADVRMLNFFRYLGQTAVLVLAILVLASMLIQNLLVPVPVSLRCAVGPDFPAESAAHSTFAAGLHRLREMRQSLPIASARGQTDHHQIRRVHRMFGVRRRVPG